MVPRWIFEIRGIVVHETSGQINVGSFVEARRWPQHRNDKVFDFCIKMMFDLKETSWYSWDFFDDAVFGQTIVVKSRFHFKFNWFEAIQWTWLYVHNVMMQKLLMTGRRQSCGSEMVCFHKVVSENNISTQSEEMHKMKQTLWHFRNCACIASSDIGQYLKSPVVSQKTF